MKCDGRGPTCGPCQRRCTGETCTWDSNINSRPMSNASKVRQLEHRLRDLEALCTTTAKGRQLVSSQSTAQHVDGGAGPTSSISDSQAAVSYQTLGSICLTPVVDSDVSMQRFSNSAEKPQANDRASVHASNQSRSPPESDDPSPMHPMIGPSEEQPPSSEFFGRSSAGSFMQNVRRVISEQSGSNIPQSSARYLASDQDSMRQHCPAYVLPPRRVADGLLSFYWRHVHKLMPILDVLQIQRGYEQLWKGDCAMKDERSFVCLMNVIFALSAQLDESMTSQERSRTSVVFYIRARDLIDVLEVGSLRAVQYCLLLGEYFQGTTQTRPGWIYVGLAVHTAQSLGLHLPETSDNERDANKRQVQRSVWHGCVFMDRLLSMTYGRPCHIGPKSAIAVPLPLEDDRIMVDNDSKECLKLVSQSKSCFFLFSLSLVNILHDMIFIFYSVNADYRNDRETCSEAFYNISSCYARVLEVERRLVDWEQRLPLRLKPETYHSNVSCNGAERREAIILHQRYVCHGI